MYIYSQAMAIGEIGQVGALVVLHVEVVQLPGHVSVITRVHQTAEATVLERLLNPRAATLIHVQVS